MNRTKPFTSLCILAMLVLLLPTLLPASAEKQLGAPSYDNSSETTYRRIKWVDFKGGGQAPPGMNRWNEGSFAHILCYPKIGGYKIEARQEDGEWVAVAAGIRPYAVMDKFHSAVKPGSRNDYSLAHEQIHFAITELMTRLMAVDLIVLEGRGAVEQEARVDLEHKIRARFEQGEGEILEMQKNYDGETNHARNRKKQKKWAEKVQEMFEQATASLKESQGQGS